MIYPLKLRSTQDAVTLSNVIAKSGEDVKITFGHVTVDPRSVLGLFALVGKNASLVGPDHMQPTKFRRLVEQIKGAIPING